MNPILRGFTKLGSFSDLLFENRVLDGPARTLSGIFVSDIAEQLDEPLRYRRGEHKLSVPSDTADNGHRAGLVQGVAIVVFLTLAVIPTLFVPEAETVVGTLAVLAAQVLPALVFGAAAGDVLEITVEPESV